MLRENYKKGKRAESLAVRFLKDLNYEILDINYSNTHGEVDIVALDGQLLVFVEVKSRNSQRYGSGAEAVDIFKQRKIINTSKSYIMSKQLWNLQVRYDVIEIDNRDEKNINHFVNAFYVE